MWYEYDVLGEPLRALILYRVFLELTENKKNKKKIEGR
jgi:hypothetical protein